jgi:uncharacterized cupredoxin-like copper-binding protein
MALAILVVAAAGAAAAQGTPAPAPAIDPRWLAVDPAAHTVEFQLTAGLTGLNGALNFNGFRDGGLTLTVPRGWTVVMHFRNHDGMLPHSAEVIAEVHPLPAQPVETAFPRAFTLSLAEGLPPEGTDDVRFTADREGSYLIFCGVPGHGAAGMWIRLRVSAAAPTASLAVSP